MALQVAEGPENRAGVAGSNPASAASAVSTGAALVGDFARLY